MNNKMQVALLLVGLLASNAMAGKLGFVALSNFPKKDKEKIEQMEEGKIVMVWSDRQTQVLKFSAYFCDWSEQIVSNDSGVTCIFKINESIDDYFAK
jgi:hypothetical protein